MPMTGDRLPTVMRFTSASCAERLASWAVMASSRACVSAATAAVMASARAEASPLTASVRACTSPASAVASAFSVAREDKDAA